MIKFKYPIWSSCTILSMDNNQSDGLWHWFIINEWNESSFTMTSSIKCYKYFSISFQIHTYEINENFERKKTRSIFISLYCIRIKYTEADAWYEAYVRLRQLYFAWQLDFYSTTTKKTTHSRNRTMN